ncbi:hypothetical protein BOW53_13960 [Solemya pervernicosa gill symbiont]|uniref:Uncharacterized protein n=1 Tax=Solemya pervernicosa gill symbiont TaxID=642797 RepID=A0A1T2L176_9GAMM|nr:hypothetical protein [Solemya pervernicosa gill symbiont]OOZ38857.1 hypothetical protein BOW53_13960 [Solemya pervernicosa gill symbiont]
MNGKELAEGLGRIRQTKSLTDYPLLIFTVCVVVFFVLKKLNLEAWFKPIYQLSFVLAILGFIMLFVQESIKCPNCGKKFNVKINGYSFVRNLFSRKCMNCGLKLDGSNIEEYHNDL